MYVQGAHAVVTVTQSGTIPLSGTFNLSVLDPSSNLVVTAEINVDSSHTALYDALQKLSPAVFQNCLIYQNIIENNNLIAFQWNITLNAAVQSPGTFTISSLALHGRGASVALRQIESQNADLSGSFSLSSSSSSVSSVSVLIAATAQQFQSLLTSLTGVHAVTVTKEATPANEAVWAVTFSSLRYAVNSPDMLHITDSSTVLGPGVASSVERVAPPASLPLMRLVAASNVTTFQLNINGSLVNTGSTFNYDSSALEIQQELEKSVGYVRVERFDRTAAIREWLILSYPILSENSTLIGSSSDLLNSGRSILSVVEGPNIHDVHVEFVQQTGNDAHDNETQIMTIT